MERRVVSSMVVLFASLWLSACGGRGPVEELAPVLEGLGDPTRSVVALSGELYRVLDEDSRAALEARAKEASAKAGVEVKASELIRAQGVGHGLRVTRVELLERGSEQSRLRVYFDAVVPAAPANAKAPAAAPAAVAPPVDLDAVLEDGRWRLRLADLGKLIRGLGLEVKGSGGGG